MNIKTTYPYDTRIQEAKIMRALVAAGENGLSRSQLARVAFPHWKLERALQRLCLFEKARCEAMKTRRGRNLRPRRGCRSPERWFALIADDTMEHGLNPEWTIEVVGA